MGRKAWSVSIAIMMALAFVYGMDWRTTRSEQHRTSEQQQHTQEEVHQAQQGGAPTPIAPLEPAAPPPATVVTVPLEALVEQRAHIRKSKARLLSRVLLPVEDTFSDQFYNAALRKSGRFGAHNNADHNIDADEPAMPDVVHRVGVEVFCRDHDLGNRTLEVVAAVEQSCGDIAEARLVGLAQELATLRGDADTLQGSGDVARRYPAMVQYLDALRLMTVRHAEHSACWQSLWGRFEHRAQEYIFERLERFGVTRPQGRLYLTAGFNGYSSVRVSNPSERTRWHHDVIMDAMRSHCTNFTMFYVATFDEDIYWLTKNLGAERRAFRNFLIDFPNFFILHYSPPMVMPNGFGASVLEENDPFYRDRAGNNQYYTMFPRMIPIPHLPYDTGSLHPKPYLQRTPKIVWRGTSTGIERPYSLSDRFRVVAQFASVDGNKADVAFASVCQNVQREQVPRISGGIGSSGLMNYQVQLDIDGNTNSWDGLRWRLLSGMLVVKARSSNGFIQWYYRHLQSGVHLIEVPVDDVKNAALNILNHPEIGSRIADNARLFAEKHLSPATLRDSVTEAVRDAWRIGYDGTTTWNVRPASR